MQKELFQTLIDRYRAGTCSREERAQLETLLNQPGYEDLLASLMDEQLEEAFSTQRHFPEVNQRITQQLLTRINETKETQIPPGAVKQGLLQPFVMWRRIAAALLVLVLISVGSYLYLSDRGSKQTRAGEEQSVTAAIEPGSDGAILTLEDGSQMILDSLGNGTITTKTGRKIMLVNGLLQYENGTAVQGVAAYNTISTPRGRQFRLQLADGSRVWLNAASSIRYPVVFNNNDRQVTVSGEVYFEVAKDVRRPFVVNVDQKMKVEVLGTHFNINSYVDEGTIRTTLLEGSVRVSSGSQQSTIRPGQQASLAHSGSAPFEVADGVDLNKIMAWKNGQFDFNNASLREVMRQLERWYDITVEYAPGVGEFEFVGKMDRGLTLQDVLKGLEMAEVKFEIVNEKKIIVKP